jgi:hypothetical protein
MRIGAALAAGVVLSFLGTTRLSAQEIVVGPECVEEQPTTIRGRLCSWYTRVTTAGPLSHLTAEKPPHVRLRSGTARPMSNPGKAPNFGYFPPSWTPWPAMPAIPQPTTAATPGWAPTPERSTTDTTPKPKTLPAPRTLDTQ